MISHHYWHNRTGYFQLTSPIDEGSIVPTIEINIRKPGYYDFALDRTYQRKKTMIPLYKFYQPGIFFIFTSLFSGKYYY